MDQKGGDLFSNVQGIVTNSVTAIEYYAKTLCEIIELGVEVGETALDPNAPLVPFSECNIPGTS